MKVIPTGDPSVTVFIVLMLFGFVVGVFGHINKSNKMIIAGIALIFLATVVIPLLVFRGGH